MSWRDVPCRIWPGYVNQNGYGRRWVDGKLRLVHVVAWEAEHGPVPEGLELDHLCERRRCYETRHLEPVTHAENLRRGRHPTVVAQRQGTCVRGHPASESYRRKSGARAGQVAYCRACRAEARNG